MQNSTRAILAAVLVLALSTACKKPTDEAAPPAGAEPAASEPASDPNAPGKTTTFEEPQPAGQTTPPSQ